MLDNLYHGTNRFLMYQDPHATWHVTCMTTDVRQDNDAKCGLCKATAPCLLLYCGSILTDLGIPCNCLRVISCKHWKKQTRCYGQAALAFTLWPKVWVWPWHSHPPNCVWPWESLLYISLSGQQQHAGPGRQDFIPHLKLCHVCAGCTIGLAPPPSLTRGRQ